MPPPHTHIETKLDMSKVIKICSSCPHMKGETQSTDLTKNCSSVMLYTLIVLISEPHSHTRTNDDDDNNKRTRSLLDT